jgi:hypothetical protein
MDHSGSSLFISIMRVLCLYHPICAAMHPLWSTVVLRTVHCQKSRKVPPRLVYCRLTFVNPAPYRSNTQQSGPDSCPTGRLEATGCNQPSHLHATPFHSRTELRSNDMEQTTFLRLILTGRPTPSGVQHRAADALLNQA